MLYASRQSSPGGRMRPSGRRRPPADVVDVLLWQLAVDVAAAHRTDPDGNCTNLACRGLLGRCAAARHAERALHLARRPVGGHPGTPPTGLPQRRDTSRHAAPAPQLPHPAPPRTRPASRLATPVIGRAATAGPHAGFTGWFTRTSASAYMQSRPADDVFFDQLPVALLAAA